MDLATTYLGLPLAHPLITGASPLVDHLDLVRRLEDAGAAAITMHSLFEEQLAMDAEATRHAVEVQAHSHPEAASYFPLVDDYAFGPDEYLEQIHRLKAAVSVPVIASLNGVTGDGWTGYARLIEQAGADALELNMYLVAVDPLESGGLLERRLLDVTAAVRASVTLPIAVKLSPFWTSLAHLAVGLDGAGADGLVLFNRFYQPDLDIEELDVVPRLRLSDPSELLLRIRWLAALAGRVRASLAASGGVHGVEDVVKAVMAGADAVQVVSALLTHGPEHLSVLRDGLARWMEEREYASIAQMRGSMSLARCPDPRAFERGGYMRVLQTWRRDTTATRQPRPPGPPD